MLKHLECEPCTLYTRVCVYLSWGMGGAARGSLGSGAVNEQNILCWRAAVRGFVFSSLSACLLAAVCA